MKASPLLSILMGILIVLAANSFLRSSEAQLETRAVQFDHVIPFATFGGFTGFFDQKTGRVYFYDTNLKECIQAFQVEELGSTLKAIK